MNMICDCCGKDGSIIKHVTRSFGTGADILVVDGVPMVVCPHCGESYFTAETLHELERLKLHRKNVNVHRQAPVVEYV
ncbi:MAG: YgiT-type zinc finger protein [PVC group bacterium]